MNKNSYSYKQGFKKGIEIFRENSSQGYSSDYSNETTTKHCKMKTNSPSL